MMIRKTIQKSIRSRLKTAFFILAVCPFVLVGIVLVWMGYIDQRNDAFELQREISNRAALQIGGYIHALEDELALTVQTSNIMNIDQDEQRKVLSRIRTYDNAYHKDVFDDLVLLNENGRELARVSRLKVYSAGDLGERSKAPEFEIPMKKREIFFGPVSLDKKSAEPLITMGMPIMDARRGTVIGVIAAEIRLKDMWNFVKDIRIGKSGNAYVVDSGGTLIVHTDPSLVLSGKNFDVPGQLGIARGLAGKMVFMWVNQIKLGGETLYIVIERPILEALSVTFRTVFLIGILLALGLAGTVAFGLIVERKIVHPIESLAGAAQAISGGDLSRRAEAAGSDEIGSLSDTFNIMATQLEETIRSLQDSEAMKVAMVNAFDGFLYVCSDGHRIEFMNDRLIENTGYDATGEVCYKVMQGLDSACPWCPDRKVIGGETVRWEAQSLRDNRWYYSVCSPVFRPDGAISKQFMIVDITDRKLAEKALKESLEEKEVLLKEIHHRVKNNMQIISSLLDIQAGYIRDKTVSAMFQESRDRIRTMALIHERLYKSADLGKIDFAEYIRELTDYLYHIYVTDPLLITLDIEANAAPMNVNTAVPLALIINELFSNALKHAFPEGKEGRIRVGITSDEDERYALVVSDNGVGFPPDTDPAGMETLGMQLVNTLVGQLKGKMEINRNPGAEFRITFQQLKRKGA